MSNKKDHQGTLINCFFCKHFYITYEPRFPYGCRSMGFKSARMPAADVFGASGADCTLFDRKEVKEQDHHD